MSTQLCLPGCEVPQPRLQYDARDLCFKLNDVANQVSELLLDQAKSERYGTTAPTALPYKIREAVAELEYVALEIKQKYGPQPKAAQAQAA
jgi:hypothetical protein